MTKLVQRWYKVDLESSLKEIPEEEASKETTKVTFDKGELSEVLFDSNGRADFSKNTITLQPYASIVIEYK